MNGVKRHQLPVIKEVHFHHKKKNLTLCGEDDNYTYCGDDFPTYMTMKSLHRTPESNLMFYVNFASRVKKQDETNGSC